MKNKIITISFLIIIFGLFIANLAKPAQELSYSERRRLAQLPELTAETLFNAKYMEGFDKFAADQFIGREQFRRIKTFADRNVMLKSDTNGLFQVNGGIYSIEYPMLENKALYMCQRLNALYARYLQGMNVYFSIVPDKNYYLPDNGSYLIMDYAALEDTMLKYMPEGATYIDLFDVLAPENYYNSDGHWRQETLKPVLDTLYKAMGNDTVFDPSRYEHKDYTPFYGAYYGQLAGMAKPDTIVWLENEVTRDAAVTSLSQPGKEGLPVYYTDGLGGMDSYDVYLYGAQPLITLENPHNDSGRELILFRDSYGSSLAPVMLEGYSKITVVDLRYITQELLAEYITFEDQDILLMYSSTIINNSDLIR